MATATAPKTTADATTERVRDLNEQILAASKKAGGAYLDAYEKALDSIAGYQTKMAQKTDDAEWLSTVIDVQARFAREVSRLYVAAGRDLLK